MKENRMYPNKSFILCQVFIYIYIYIYVIKIREKYIKSIGGYQSNSTNPHKSVSWPKQVIHIFKTTQVDLPRFNPKTNQRSTLWWMDRPSTRKLVHIPSTHFNKWQ